MTDFRLLSLLLFFLVALTACGGSPAEVVYDRRYLSDADRAQQIEQLRAQSTGEILDTYVGTLGEEDYFMVLTREYDPATHYSGIYLRRYRLAFPAAELLWTYQDSLACQATESGTEAARPAGAGDVFNRTASLAPAPWLEPSALHFLLSYQLKCGEEEASQSLVLVNLLSGTPDLRLTGDAAGPLEGADLVGLPEDTIGRLLAAWH
ncbi:hypothetical protein QWY85_03980 [Neolewinella lacunae]|uniref:Lipoprotein n=1 Tax=Neolewinella lacunae TaxID=1517758 RepID=A0A923PMN5_9BACT|nr:hypothetical protein [Neolewinella lacunae]MBC6996825.1 hypothetical protein [Neolewinella lacunae]MDN3633803.1 hypothetical protein [Neolewinella lacunae]